MSRQAERYRFTPRTCHPPPINQMAAVSLWPHVAARPNTCINTDAAIHRVLLVLEIRVLIPHIATHELGETPRDTHSALMIIIAP